MLNKFYYINIINIINIILKSCLMNICIGIKKNGEKCVYKAKNGLYCNIHSKGKTEINLIQSKVIKNSIIQIDENEQKASIILSNILNDILNYKHNNNDSKTQHNSTIFEEIFIKLCNTYNISVIDNNSIIIKYILKIIKKDILNKQENHNNIFIIDEYNVNLPEIFIIYQPFGSQNIPDFLFVYYKSNTNKLIVQPIEMKSGKLYPVWNNNPPKNNFIYIFSSGIHKKTTYFLGKSHINENEIRIITEYIVKRKLLAKEYNDIFKNINSNFKFIDYFKIEDTKTSYINDKNIEEQNEVIQYLSNLFI